MHKNGYAHKELGSTYLPNLRRQKNRLVILLPIPLSTFGGPQPAASLLLSGGLCTFHSDTFADDFWIVIQISSEDGATKKYHGGAAHCPSSSDLEWLVPNCNLLSNP